MSTSDSITHTATTDSAYDNNYEIHGRNADGSLDHSPVVKAVANLSGCLCFRPRQRHHAPLCQRRVVVHSVRY